MKVAGQSLFAGVLIDLERLRVLDEALTEAEVSDRVAAGPLFVVAIDLNFAGEFGAADWQPNSDPQPLADALDEAAELRKPQAEGYPWFSRVEPA